MTEHLKQTQHNINPALNAIARDASAAQDAADQSAAATAAIAAKGAAATKAASTAAAVAKMAAAGTAAFQFQLRPIVGGVLVPPIVRVDPTKVDPNSAFDASARARENVGIIKANFLGGIKGIADVFGGAQRTASSSVDATDVVGGYASTLADAIASLRLGEYGGRYAAVVMGLIALRKRTAGREDATAAYEDELAAARERANEAATAAGLAAEGAKEARMLAMRMERDITEDGGKALLESSRSKMAEVEKASVSLLVSVICFISRTPSLTTLSNG